VLELGHNGLALKAARRRRFAGIAAPAGKAAYESSRLGHGVLTYAILEALHRPEGAAANDVTVWEIAKHVSRRVPVLSQREFGVRQIPHFSPGNTEGGGREDFPLGLRTVVLKGLPPQIPTTATHVNLARLKVFKEAGGKGGVILQLQPLTSVTLCAHRSRFTPKPPNRGFR
jgi:hypothetical protein